MRRKKKKKKIGTIIASKFQKNECPYTRATYRAKEKKMALQQVSVPSIKYYRYLQYYQNCLALLHRRN